MIASTKSATGESHPEEPAAPTLPDRSLGLSLPGLDPAELSGSLIVLDGADGAGVSTQILLLTEWLEGEGFAVQTTQLRGSNLVGANLDLLLATNIVNRITLALMYATDFYDQLEHRIVPALRSGLVVLADRYIYTLIARAVVRGLDRGYLHRIYQMALKPDLAFWLDISGEVAFAREFKKANAISYWEAGMDLSLASNLYDSFILYQRKLRGEFEVLAHEHSQVQVNAGGSVPSINKELRHRIAAHLGIKSTRYSPSSALASIWR